MKIAIDGTAASGKGTLSENLSKELKLPRLDTGLLYRKLAFMYIKSLKLIPTQNTIDNSILKSILNDFDLNDLKPEALKQDLYGNFASRLGKLDFVRKKLKIIQIEFVENMIKKRGGCILDGRDIGTEILPDADFKFYIDAPIKTRAKRRYKQLYSTNKSIEFKTSKLKILSFSLPNLVPTAAQVGHRPVFWRCKRYYFGLVSLKLDHVVGVHIVRVGLIVTSQRASAARRP